MDPKILPETFLKSFEVVCVQIWMSEVFKTACAEFEIFKKVGPKTDQFLKKKFENMIFHFVESCTLDRIYTVYFDIRSVSE